MDYVSYKWWSMNDKTVYLPHLVTGKRMSEVVISKVHHLCGEPELQNGLDVETPRGEYNHNHY